MKKVNYEHIEIVYIAERGITIPEIVCTPDMLLLLLNDVFLFPYKVFLFATWSFVTNTLGPNLEYTYVLKV